jgi:hypothetical protein
MVGRPAHDPSNSIAPSASTATPWRFDPRLTAVPSFRMLDRQSRELYDFDHASVQLPLAAGAGALSAQPPNLIGVQVVAHFRLFRDIPIRYPNPARGPNGSSRCRRHR